MYIHNISIKNFRLLMDVELALEEETTLIVGRNNSGKTSLSEIMKRFLTDSNPTFQLEDFPSASFENFCKAHEAYRDRNDEFGARELLPAIQLCLQIRYDQAQAEFGTLAPFIVDLDPNCFEALITIHYNLKDGGLAGFFEGTPTCQSVAENPQAFLKLIRERIPKFFTVKIWAEDPSDCTNRRLIKQGDLRNLVKTGFINAQRGLDDVTTRETDVLAKILEGLFSTASSDLADEQDKRLVETLTEAVQEIQTQMDQGFGEKLKALLPALNTFGYPGLGGQELHTETTLDVRRLLTNFTKVRYAGHGGIALPEAYNGLGIRNLIFILLQLVGFYKAYRAEHTSPGMHLIFIEEPEAHLHPQMQEVFIRQLSKIAKQLSVDGESDGVWPVQFVVSTRSSHIANETGFEAIRYFLSTDVPNRAVDFRQTKIKDLREGMTGNSPENRRFLHQYLTLTRCDLFFADKAILVEGLSERLLLPIIIKKLENAEPESLRLSTQYNTIMEVGGAYAYIFFELLNFLELRTLIITDLDAVIKSGGKACAVHKGSTTRLCLN